MEKAVRELPEHHKIVFVLRELEGRTYEEIAEITDTNLGNRQEPSESGSKQLCPDRGADDRLTRRLLKK